MNISHVISYIETVKLGSISAAAERCSLSQSALSQQIKTLEKTFNIKLIDRSHKGIVPTAAGEITYTNFLSILDSCNNIYQEIDKLNSTDESIKIASTPFACAYALPCTFYHFKSKYPNYSLEIETIQSDDIEQKILKRSSDLGIIIGEPRDKRLTYKKVFSDAFLLVCSTVFDIPDTISKNDIYNYPFVMLSNSHKTQRILKDQLLLNEIDYEKLNILYSIDTAEAMKISAVNGFGIALLPYMSIKKELYHKQLRIVQCTDLKLEGSYYSIKQRTDDHLCMGREKAIQQLEKIISQTIC